MIFRRTRSVIHQSLLDNAILLNHIAAFPRKHCVIFMLRRCIVATSSRPQFKSLRSYILEFIIISKLPYWFHNFFQYSLKWRVYVVQQRFYWTMLWTHLNSRRKNTTLYYRSTTRCSNIRHYRTDLEGLNIILFFNSKNHKHYKSDKFFPYTVCCKYR